jgi:hypothetical protein
MAEHASQPGSPEPSPTVAARRPRYDNAALNAARARRRVLLEDANNPAISVKELTARVDPLAFEGMHLVNDARYEDIARRLWMQQSVAEIAEAHGVSDRRMRIILREPGMVTAYLRVKAELFANLDNTLFDERAAPLLRARVQAIRAQTLLSEVVEEIRTRLNEGKASATAMKVGVDAAFGIIDRSGGELALRRGGGATVNVNVGTGATFRDGTDALIRGAISESGLDLSDLVAAPRTIDVDGNVEARADAGE